MPSDRDDRGRTPAGDVGESDREDTGTYALRRVVRDTQRTVSHTADRVGELRSELGDRIDRIDAKVDGLEVSGARLEGKVDVLVDGIALAARERSAIHVTRVTAEIEVEKTGEIAKLTEAAAVREHRRQRTIKMIAIVGPIITALATALATKC